MDELTHIIAKHSPEPEMLLLLIFLFALGKSVIFVSSVLPPASVTLLMGKSLRASTRCLSAPFGRLSPSEPRWDRSCRSTVARCYAAAILAAGYRRVFMRRCTKPSAPCKKEGCHCCSPRVFWR